MRRIHIAAVAALIAIMLSGCGGDAAVKPSAERTKAETAIMKVSQLFDLYIARDLSGVIERVSDGYKGGYGVFMGRMRKDMEAIEKVDLNYEVERVEIMDGTVGVVIKWKGYWHTNEGKEVESRGASFLVFEDTEEMKLLEVVGDNPFGILW